MAGGSPETLVQGPALTRQRIKKKLIKALSEWDGKTEFKEFLKYQMPEASDKFIDKFTDMVNKVKVKKANLKKAETSLYDFINQTSDKTELIKSLIEAKTLTLLLQGL